MSATLYARVVGGDCAETQDAHSMTAFIADALGGDTRAFAIAGRVVESAMENPRTNVTASGVVLVSLAGMPDEPTADEQISALHRAAHAAQEARKKVEKRAGRALRDRDSVLSQQSDAIDFFASDNFGDMTNKQIAQAARRIARFSEMLDAAEDHGYYARQEQQAKDRLAEARERLDRKPIRPVAGRRS